MGGKIQRLAGLKSLLDIVIATEKAAQTRRKPSLTCRGSII